MAGELVETSRLWGRDLGRIEPEWVEPLAEHLVKRTYSEPHWSAKQGAAMAVERVTLYGVPLVAGRKVAYGRIDPEVSRDLFIRHALVEGEWRTHHRFFHDNRELLEDVEELEHRARRRDILVDDETLVAFYDERVPADVVSGPALRRVVEEGAPRAAGPAHLRPGDAGARRAPARSAPPTTRTAGSRATSTLPLTYQFEPGADADGVTVHVPLTVLNRLSADGFDWQVPGLRAELVTALLRSLPKALRRSFVPAPDTRRRRAAGRSAPGRRRAVRRRAGPRAAHATGVTVPRDAWDLAKVPDHLRMTFRVEDDGAVVAEGKDLAALRDRLAPTVRRTVAAAAAEVERAGLTSWSFGDLPATFAREVDGRTVQGFPALVDEGTTVALRVLGSEREAQAATWSGVRRLLALTVPSPLKGVVSRLDNASKLAFGNNPHGSVPALLDDGVTAALDALLGPARRAAARRRRLRAAAGRGAGRAAGDDVRRGGDGGAHPRRRARRVEPGVRCGLPRGAAGLARRPGPAGSGWCTRASSPATGVDRLPDLLRYLTAMQRRLDALPGATGRDRERLARVEQVEQEHAAWLAGLRPERRDDPEVRAVRWMLEELRVSLFAQQLGTP